MAIPIIYTDSDKSKYYSTDDYVTMSDYHHSFRSANQTSQLRSVISPGTAKYFNKSLFSKAIADNKNLPYSTEVKLEPITSYGRDDGFDYMSYPKK